MLKLAYQLSGIVRMIVVDDAYIDVFDLVICGEW